MGTIDDIQKRAGESEPLAWLDDYVKKLNKEEKENSRKIIKIYSPQKEIPMSTKSSFNGGYLFLQDIYHKLGLNNICNDISAKYQFKYDLNSILSNLVYSRIIFPSSKHKTLELSKNFVEQPNFDLQHIYRALEVLSKEGNFIQSELYKNSLDHSKRNDKVLFYDCTNFYFEIEQEDGLKKYGKSKENKPNPIVQMGLFMDGDGIPLAFDITPGNQNEQKTLKPLEKQIIEDFEHSKFIVCTDAGLSSKDNRKFNSMGNRGFITTQSIKKLKSHEEDWATDMTKEWKLPGSEKTYNLTKLRTDDKLIKRNPNLTFYKERWIKDGDMEQRLIVTYSVKYQEYHKNIRERQIERALKMLDKNPKILSKPKQNDPRRFITTIDVTSDGEVATEKYYDINSFLIEEEAKYDGLYAVCTNLEDDVNTIIKINHRRWEIEESFRIMKTEFKARPIFLSRDDRIKAHFTTCFLALTVFRFLEKKLEEKYTVTEIIETLRNMNFLRESNEGYIPIYTRTLLTNELHDKFGFRTDYEIVVDKNMKKIISQTKRQ